jgi:hypothetical protein
MKKNKKSKRVPPRFIACYSDGTFIRGFMTIGRMWMFVHATPGTHGRHADGTLLSELSVRLGTTVYRGFSNCEQALGLRLVA